MKKGQQVAWCRADGSIQRVKITELLMTEALERKPADSAGPGDIIALAGIPEITIGETLADPENPIPLPLITVDEPAISMTIGTNTSPLVGRVKGTKVTARLVKDRIDRELVGNVSIRVLPTERPDAWEVQGRGELALAILVEQMRREGYEMTVGKPQVVTREIDGKLHEPFERLTIDAPEEYLGAITQLLAVRKGRMEQMTNHGTGWVRMEFVVPSRGLIGFRTEFLTDTRGTGIANHVFEAYEPWVGELQTRQNGSLVADRTGVATSYAMFNLQERGTMFLEPTTEVYEGMVVGENSRVEDMDVNISKEKKLTNVRSAGAEVLERLVPAAPDEPRAGAGVLPRGRVRRGHPRRGPHPQGGPEHQRAGPHVGAGQDGGQVLLLTPSAPASHRADDAARPLSTPGRRGPRRVLRGHPLRSRSGDIRPPAAHHPDMLVYGFAVQELAKCCASACAETGTPLHSKVEMRFVSHDDGSWSARGTTRRPGRPVGHGRCGRDQGPLPVADRLRPAQARQGHLVAGHRHGPVPAGGADLPLLAALEIINPYGNHPELVTGLGSLPTGRSAG